MTTRGQKMHHKSLNYTEMHKFTFVFLMWCGLDIKKATVFYMFQM